MPKKMERFPILLTEEEISNLSEEWLNADEDVDWANYLCKAQLRKLIEWLEDRGYFIVENTPPLIKGDFFLCKLNWEELIEEKQLLFSVDEEKL